MQGLAPEDFLNFFVRRGYIVHDLKRHKEYAVEGHNERGAGLGLTVSSFRPENDPATMVDTEGVRRWLHLFHNGTNQPRSSVSASHDLIMWHTRTGTSPPYL